VTVTLAQVVAQTESRGNPWAVRFEPAVYARYLAVDDQTATAIGAQIREFEQIHGCSPDTARVLLSSSWGRYQIMGFNLGQHVLQFAADPDSQDAKFIVFCQRLGVTDAQMADASWLIDDAAGMDFATRYNGPAKPASYLASLRASYAALNAPPA
jgi:hypothetical protein